MNRLTNIEQWYKKEIFKMKYIDLHVHSNISDGTLSPTELVEEACKCKVAAFALTDHDSVNGVEEAIEAAKNLAKQGQNVEVIAGAEISVAYKNKDIHMLGLFLDHHNSTLIDTLQAAKIERDKRNEKMIQNLADAGLDIDIERIYEKEGKETILTRAHIGKFLYETGQVSSVNDAFKKYLSADGPYYVPRKYLSPQKAIYLIKQAGGIPVLAHPLIYGLPEQELDILIGTLKEQGLEGIEVFYSSNTGFDEGIVRRYANRYNLIMTGGSDFHGANKPAISLGSGRGNLRIPYSVLDNIRTHLSQRDI